MDRVYGSQDHDWLFICGGLTAMERRSRFRAWEVIVIARREREREGEIREREREEFVGVLTNDASWRQSCGDGHTTALNRGGRWCSDGEMVPDASRMSRGGCGGY
jgi:hypothetical protein